MKEEHFSYKFLILIIILFTCLFIFSATSLALIPGDFGSAEGPTPDGCVDFEDLMIFALAYGSTPADSNWNEVCDIASEGGVLEPDDKIDFEDLMIFALHYGECSVHNLTKDTYYNTIQAALDDADSGNTIEVGDGTYTGSITFPSDNMIILQSVNGDSSTTIVGDNGSPTVTCSNSLEGTTLEGFTITHNSADNGRGIIIFGGYLNINSCTISENSSTYGGGISNSGTLTITTSTISHNSAAHSCGGIHNSGTLTITSSNISHNSASYDGGIYLSGSGIATIGGSGEENVICGNYKTGEAPSLDQQIRDTSGSLYDTYKDTNHISAYCK